MPRKQHYRVQIRRNGAVYGDLGPYSRRADAESDAAALSGEGRTVEVKVTKNGKQQDLFGSPPPARAKRRRLPYLVSLDDAEIQRLFARAYRASQAREAIDGNYIELLSEIRHRLPPEKVDPADEKWLDSLPILDSSFIGVPALMDDTPSNRRAVRRAMRLAGKPY